MYEKIVIVTRETRLEGLIRRFVTRPQAKFYVEHSGGNFRMYEREHDAYYAALRQLKAGAEHHARLQVIERAYLPNFLFTSEQLIITIGIDGLVVNTAKYANGQPVLAVNPDPAHIDGVLLPFSVPEALSILPDALQGKARTRQVSMAEARLNDGQSLLAFNDLFIGRNDQVSARYRISFDGSGETHSSSGIIVSTGAGSTGWLSSLFNMAEGMLAGFAGEQQPLPRPQLSWESDRLLFVVREPFASRTSSAVIICGELTVERPLLLESNMPDGGVIFSDGIAADHLAFNSGSVATILPAERKTRLVVH